MEWSLATERLIVRRFVPADLDAFHRYRNDPEVARSQGWSVPYSLADARSLVHEMTGTDLFRRGAWTQLAVERQDVSGLIGDVGLRIEADEPTAELGVTFSTAAQGLGFATETLTVVVDHLLSALGFERVIAIARQDNDRVQRLLERVGFAAVARDGNELIFSRHAVTA